MLKFAITLAVCTATGLAVKKMKVPGGVLVGALLGGILLQAFTSLGYMPYAGRFAAQVAAGAYIGALFNRAQLKSIGHVWKTYVLVLCFFLAANLVGGFLIWKTGACDLMTALLSCVPGGMSDTPLIAADLGADVGTVAILQFVRMVTGVALMPTVISLTVPGTASKASAPTAPAPGEKKSWPLTVLTLAAATAGAFLGKLSGIPAGILVGSMVAVIVQNLTLGKAHLPMPIKRGAQILSGAYIGCTMSRERLLGLGELVLPALIILAVYIPASLVCGHLISKCFHRDLKESLLCATPGGASDMALIAADLGVESTDLLVTQILRMVTVVLIFPQVIYQLCRLLGQLPL